MTKKIHNPVTGRDYPIREADTHHKAGLWDKSKQNMKELLLTQVEKEQEITKLLRILISGTKVERIWIADVIAEAQLAKDEARFAKTKPILEKQCFDAISKDTIKALEVLTEEAKQGAYNRGFEQGKFEERERIINELEPCMAGLDLEHPEYYSKQAFAVMPAKYWQAFKEGKCTQS